MLDIMNDNDIEILKKVIGGASDEKINKLPEVFARDIHGLNDEQIVTVSFVFWLAYVAEVQLYEAISESWAKSKNKFSVDAQIMAKQMIEEKIPSKKNIDIEKLDYFTDKIQVLEAVFGQHDYVKFLYDLRNLRNDISHNRIDNLEYKGISLYERSAKENIIIDLVVLASNFDGSKSELLNALSEI